MITVQKKVIILGAGNFAEEVLDVAQESGFADIACFVEGIDRNQCGKKIAGIPVIWIDDVANFDNSHALLCGIGSPKRKILIEQVLAHGLDFINVVHPTVRLSSTVRMGKDVFISVGSILAAGCSVGDHVIINRAAVIGHNVRIDDFTTISPGANIGGRSSIGEGSYIGMGSIILDGIKVGPGSIIGAGAVVTKDVPENVQVMGIPAKIIKRWI
jgi:sugar O-acyltransferase (sialic acid O-acetyltransferase NeuD family)